MPQSRVFECSDIDGGETVELDAQDDGGGSEAKRFRAQEAGADHATAAGRRRPFASDAYESIH